jgi:hypothetical protein
VSLATFHIDGESWSIMGNVTIDFMPYENKPEAARDGRIFNVTDTKVPMFKLDKIMVDKTEVADLIAFITDCSSKVFSCLLSFDSDCGDAALIGTDMYFAKCRIAGSPSYSPFENSVSGFEVSYEGKPIVKSA